MDIIIGERLTGLSVAYHLNSGYLVLEKDRRVGGFAEQSFTNGFGFNYVIHALYTSNPYVANLIQNNFLKNNLMVR
jgi:protoporphyrinogen oxidase